MNRVMIWEHSLFFVLIISKMVSLTGKQYKMSCFIFCCFFCRKKKYTGCHRRNGPNFGRVFLMLNYTDITQNTYIQS